MPNLPDKTELFCLGNAIVDVFAAVDPARLDGWGITEPVQHISREQAGRILAELGAEASLSSGGGAANAAKIAAMLDTSAVFAGCTGSDDLAAVFEKDLVDAGVTPVLSTGTEKTGLYFAFDCGGGKTRIAASPGAALEFSEADVREDLIAGAEAIVLDGYMLDRRSLVRHIMHLTNRYGIPIALDVASVLNIKEKTEDILHYGRNYPLIVFMNADETIVFYNTIRKNSDKIETLTEKEKETLIIKEICPVLKCMTEGEIFPVIVIKLGKHGAVVLAGGNIHREETFAIIPHDAVGAGDAFCAAFLAAWIRGKPIRECAALGNKVAKEILLVPGTRIKSDKLKSLAKMLHK